MLELTLFAELIYWRDQREQRVHSMGFIVRHAHMHTHTHTHTRTHTHAHTHTHIRLMLFTCYHLVSVYLAFSHSTTPPHRAAWAGTKARWEAALPGRELSGILLCGPRARWGERDNLQSQEGKHTTCWWRCRKKMHSLAVKEDRELILHPCCRDSWWMEVQRGSKLSGNSLHY